MIAVIDSAIDVRGKTIVRLSVAGQPDPLRPDRQMDGRAGANVADREGGRLQSAR